MTRSRSSRRGIALMLVLWCVSLLSLLVIGVVLLVSDNLEDDGASTRELHARLLAESGLAVALHPSVRRYDPLLTREISPVEGYQVKLQKEAGRLNINRLLANESGRDTLLRLLNLWGIDVKSAETLVDVLVDWVDADDERQLNGAEWSDYEEAGRAGDPPNEAFRSVNELARVPGWEQVSDTIPEWRNYFTVWGDGRLDLLEARAVTIAAVCDLPLDSAQKFVEVRGGTEDEPPSQDDVLVRNPQQAAAALGISQSAFQKFANRVTLDSSLVRIESTGYIGRSRKTVTVVTSRGGRGSSHLDWQEQ
jgi:type II secretory pathway component PulK